MANPGLQPSIQANKRCLLQLAYPCWKDMFSYYSSVAAGTIDAIPMYTKLMEALQDQTEVMNDPGSSLFDMVYGYKSPESGLSALISEYLFMFDNYVSDRVSNNTKSIIESIFKMDESKSIKPSEPYLKQMIEFVNLRFQEWESSNLFVVDLQVTNPSAPTKPNRPGSSSNEEDADTPLDPCIKECSPPTPLDDHAKYALYKEAMKRHRGEGGEDDGGGDGGDNKRALIKSPHPFGDLFVYLVRR